GAQETVQGVLYLVEDKTRDVTLRQELIAANAAKDQFLALLSHELRSPLATRAPGIDPWRHLRSEEHTSELQSRGHLVCRLLLEKKKNKNHLSKRAVQLNKPAAKKPDTHRNTL